MTLYRALFLTAALAFGVAGARDQWDAWIDATELPPVLAETSVEIRDHAGQLLQAYPVENGRLRLSIRSESVDRDFIDMLVAYEDKRFWNHSGVDGVALLRAAAQAVSSGRIVSGGSTLTMQVARLLENGPTRSVAGKLRQMRVAWALERRLDKDRILGLYLQHAPYGGRIEGVRSASRIWFGKDPQRLSDAEAALLIALPQSPETRRPDRYPEAARAARDRVLRRLGKAPVFADVPRTMGSMPRTAPHFADRVVRNTPLAAVVHTSLEGGLQKQVETLARTHMRALPQRASVAVLVADHGTGAIRAYLGAPYFSDQNDSAGFVDMVQASRSPGSTLKPVVYALAFDRGLAHPETILRDTPMHFGQYAPQNFDGGFRGDISARAALSASLNVPVVALTDVIGPDRLYDTLRRFGAEPRLPGVSGPGLALALGGAGLSLHDLVQLYAGLAQLGQAQRLRSDADAGPRVQVLSPRAAWYVMDILADVPPPGGMRPGIAYKTGTSYGHRDAWAIGFDGQHVVGVWVGRPDGTPVPGMTGAAQAAPLLFEVFERVAPQRVPLPVAPADALTVTHDALPLPLKRFGAARDVAAVPQVIFPPDGALLMGDETVLKVRGGALPLTLLRNGVPSGPYQARQIPIKELEAGFSEMSVIDALGRAARVTIEARR